MENYAFSRLSITDAAGACRLRPMDLMVDYHAGSAYAVMPFAANCPAMGGELTLLYRLLFDLDPTHRGLITVGGRGSVTSDVLTPDHSTVILGVVPQPITREIAQFLLFGFDHILLGYDHLLFVAVLLVLAPLRRTRRVPVAPDRWPLPGRARDIENSHRLHRGARDHPHAGGARGDKPAVTTDRSSHSVDDHVGRARQSLADIAPVALERSVSIWPDPRPRLCKRAWADATSAGPVGAGSRLFQYRRRGDRSRWRCC